MDSSLPITSSTVRSPSFVSCIRESGVYEDIQEHSGATTVKDKRILDLMLKNAELQFEGFS